jgi:hypothetical protein
MKRLLSGCVVALALTETCATAAPSPRQFDLICEGTAGHYGLDGELRGEPWHRRYAIDLDRNAFCRDGCSQVEALGVEPGRLVFSGQEDVGRANGHMAFVDSMNRAVSASCSPAPFTPMPANRF